MRISHLTVSNFLGLPAFDVATAPFLFVAGPNGAGKSSLHDAIRFCLLGELPRGCKAGARADLITDGAAAGYVQLCVDGFHLRRNIGSGKADGDALQLADALGLCLDAPRFAHLPEAERRALLFRLADVRVNRDTVDAELARAGLGADYCAAVLPLLRDGFPAAADYARKQAAEARGEWKGITGEAYGRVKAATWAAERPEVAASDAELAERRAKVRAVEARVQALLEIKGRVDAAPSAEKLAALRAQADQREALEADLAEAEARHADALTRLRALPPDPAHVHTMTCPACAVALRLHAGELVRGEDDVPKHTRQRQARDRAEAQQQADLTHSAVDAARRSLNAAQAAALTLESLVPASAADLQALCELDTARNDLALHRQALSADEDALARATRAQERSERAMAAHERVAQWELAEQQLGPDGIPAVLLSRALDPVNAALAAQAEAAGFRIAAIQRDLTLTYGGRPYALCSESEQWRASALFALVVAVLSGVKLLALDRFDVLQPDVRGEVIDWLKALLASGALEFVLVTATLKSALPDEDGITSRWLGA